MAPRKTASAGEDNQCPTLKLIIEKGPLSGQTNEFSPESVVHIGRIVRGNTLSIKDDGISSKHLRIAVEPVSDSGRRRWTVTDLGSSNGTRLNSVELEPSKAAVLSDMDAIKIGEQTTIRVKFEVNGGENKVDSGNVRRNARRRVRNQVAELGVIDEDSELGLGDNNLGAGLKNKKFEGLGNEGGRFVAVDEKKTRGRPRGSVARELENRGEEDQAKMVGKGKVSLSKKEKKGNLMIDLDEDEEQQSNMVAEVEGKQERNAGFRRTRSSKNNENLNIDADKNLERMSTRRTRSSTKKENIGFTVIDLDVINVKKAPKGRRGRKKLHVETHLGEEEEDDKSNMEQTICEEDERRSEVGVNELLDREKREGAANVCTERKSLPAKTPLGEKEGKLNMEHSICEEEKRISEVGANELLDRENSERECAASACTSGVKEGRVDVGEGEVLPDLEKMTMGEWFVFLEDFLPKQIIAETEAIISEMEEEAKRVNEFMLQQKHVKDKGKVAMNEMID